jgi:hypothetical protein
MESASLERLKKCAFSHDRSLMKKSDIEQPKTVRLFKSEM